jgi:hypothetical protein
MFKCPDLTWPFFDPWIFFKYLEPMGIAKFKCLPPPHTHTHTHIGPYHLHKFFMVITPSPPRYPKNTIYSSVNNRSCNTFPIYFTLVIVTFGLRCCMKMKHNFNSLTKNHLFHPPYDWLEMFQENVATNNTNFDSLTKNMFIVFCACWKGLEWCPKILDIDETITRKENIHKSVTIINNNNIGAIQNLILSLKSYQTKNSH